MTFDLLQFKMLAFSIFPQLVLVLEFVVVLLHFVAHILQDDQLILQFTAAGTQAGNSLPRRVNFRLDLGKFWHLGQKLVDVCHLLIQLSRYVCNYGIHFLKQIYEL